MLLQSASFRVRQQATGLYLVLQKPKRGTIVYLEFPSAVVWSSAVAPARMDFLPHPHGSARGLFSLALSFLPRDLSIRFQPLTGHRLAPGPFL